MSIDKLDTQLVEMDGHMDEHFAEMNKQLDRIATVVVKGFDRIDKVLESKADKTDIDRIFNLLDKIAKNKKLMKMNGWLWDINRPLQTPTCKL